MSAFVHEALREIRAATDDLLRATVEWDPEAVNGALTRRAAGIARLEQRIAAVEDQASPEERTLLSGELRCIEERAARAVEQLTYVMNQTRSALRNLSRESRALRGYAAAPPQAGALERAG